MKFTYFDNSKGWHTKLVFQCEANSILEADQKFIEKIGIDPKKNSNIGCVIE